MAPRKQPKRRQPKGPEFPGQLIADLLEITPRRLQQLVAAGWIERPAHGRYNLVASVRGYVRFLKSRQQRR